MDSPEGRVFETLEQVANLVTYNAFFIYTVKMHAIAVIHFIPPSKTLVGTWTTLRFVLTGIPEKYLLG